MCELKLKKGLLCGAVMAVAMLGVIAIAPEQAMADTIRLEIEEGKKDITVELNEALLKATQTGTSKEPSTVVVPAGKYTINNMLHIYSNTTLDLTEGVTISAADSAVKFNMVLAGTNEAFGDYTDYNNSEGCKGYSGFKNITIKGGTWKGNSSNSSVLMRVAHANNVKLEGVTLQGGGGVHQMEVAAIDGFTVDGCKFKSFGDGNYIEGRRMEALQLDVVCDNQAFPDYYQDGTPMKNIKIVNSTFSNVPRGIGGHNMLMNSYFDNVIIENNLFKNIDEEAISCLNWINSKIKDNTISNCGGGILFQFYKTDATTNLYVTLFDGEKKYKGTQVTDANTVIEGNNITTAYTGTGYEVQGIKIFGFDNSDGVAKARYNKALPKTNYCVSGITIKDNVIKSAGFGIHMQDTRNSVIANNSITQENVSDKDACRNSYDGIYVTDASKGIKVIDNPVISGFMRDGIDITKKSVATEVSGNKVTNTRKVGIQLYSGGIVNNIDNNTVSGGKADAININTGLSEECMNICHNNITGVKNYVGIYVKGGNVNIYANSIANVTSGICIASKSGGYIKANNKYSSVDRRVYVVDKKSYSASTKKLSWKEVTKDKGKLALKWKKQKHADGYEVQCTSDSAFKKNIVNVNIAGNVSSVHIGKLSTGTKYYLRIRGYKKCNGIKVYSKYSSKRVISL